MRSSGNPPSVLLGPPVKAPPAAARAIADSDIADGRPWRHRLRPAAAGRRNDSACNDRACTKRARSEYVCPHSARAHAGRTPRGAGCGRARSGAA